MNTFVQAIDPRTQNGAKTLASSGSIFVDLFSMIGSAKNANEVSSLFTRAFNKDAGLAIRIALWSRDCRGGAGRRLGFEAILRNLAQNAPELVRRMIPHIATYGRYDDLLPLLHFPNIRANVAEYLLTEVKTNKLAGKWMPREKSAQKQEAKILMRAWGMDSKTYRKFLVVHSDTVETKMCAKDYSDIVYPHVPSVAMARYQAAFNRNDYARFSEYKESLKKGEVKVNADALYPHDVVRSLQKGDSAVANAQWSALPNFIPEGISILPIVDVSGSMGVLVSGSIRAIDISASLGIYLAERQTSAFKDVFVTFHTSPTLQKLPEGEFSDRYHAIMRAPWGGSTDFLASMQLVLNHARKNEVDPKDMPQYMICISDMEFNQAGNKTNFEVAKQVFEQSGYKMPKLIFWNVNSRSANVQVKENQQGVAMVSGFAPAAVKAILSGNSYDPFDAMIDTVVVERYDIEGVTL